MSKELSEEKRKQLKNEGFLVNTGTDTYDARVVTKNGRISAEQIMMLAKAAEDYGDGYMRLKGRASLEISGIYYEKIEEFQNEISRAGLVTGGTGFRVRPIVSCKGSTCRHGLYDTYRLGEKLHDRFFIGYRDIPLPNKLKIAVGGCPNNCLKPTMNDIGIVGYKRPLIDIDSCRSCKICQMEEACTFGAAVLSEGKLKLNSKLCTGCGRCVEKCPFHVSDHSESGWKVYIGGRSGRKNVHGTALSKLFRTEEEVMDVVEKTILFYKTEGIRKEKLADTIDRIGFDIVEKIVLGEKNRREL